MIAKTYQDLLGEIQYYNTRINQLEFERAALLIKCRAPAGYPNGNMDVTGVRGAAKFMSVEEIFLRIQAIEESIRDGERMLKPLSRQLSEINTLLYNLEGKQYKIFWLHKCENKSYQDIAKEIGMSAKQVQRIYKEVAGDE